MPTGRELIEMIEKNCNLDDEVYITDASGTLTEIVEVRQETKRDPYDGDWDTTVSVIAMS